MKVPWHTGHDYELAKLGHQFLYLAHTGRAWATHHRPVPPNIRPVFGLEERPSDVLVLHLDQWGWHEPSKRLLYLRLRDQYEGPKVTIVHGCNLVDGCESEVLASLVAGTHVVVNSATALERWAIPGARYIRHGMSPEEWPETDHSCCEVVVVQSRHDRHGACGNHALVDQASRVVPLTWVGRDVALRSFAEYQRFLSSRSVFFNPSFASANPRARTEAMLCGLAVVTTAMHGEGEYIENGVNGYCSNDPAELLDMLRFLVANPERARAMGKRGRALAQERFHIDQFRASWERLLSEVVGPG